MIPDKLLRDAQADYRGNVCQFLSLGERKNLDRFDYIRIKQKSLGLQDWIEQLDTACRAVMDDESSAGGVGVI